MFNLFLYVIKGLLRLYYSHFLTENWCVNTPNMKVPRVLMADTENRKKPRTNERELKIWADSGANVHIVNIPLKEFEEVRATWLRVNTASSQAVSCLWKGRLGPLDNVYQSTEVSTNLLSVSQLCTDRDLVVIFTKDEVLVYNTRPSCFSESALWKGRINNGMYLLNIPLDTLPSYSNANAMVTDAIVINRYTQWHRRMNHMGRTHMRRLQEKYPCMQWKKEDEIAHHTQTCVGCLRGKLAQKSHFSVSRGLAGIKYAIEKPGDLILVDLYFSNLPDRFNHYIGLIIVDAFSKCIFTMSGTSKAEAGNMFKSWVQECARLKVNISKFAIVRSDNGGEFIGQLFQDVLQELNIWHERVPPYSHVNKAERAIRHLKENTRALIEDRLENLQRAALHVTKGQSKNPYIFWSDAATHVCRVSNTMVADKRDKSRQQKFFKEEIISVEQLRVFASRVYVHVNAHTRQTWDATAREGLYLGNDLMSPLAHKILMLDTKKVVNAETVIFNENIDSLISNYVTVGNNNVTSDSDYWYSESQTGRVNNTQIALRSIEWTLDEDESVSPTVMSVMVNDSRYEDDEEPTECSDLVLEDIPKNLREALSMPKWRESYEKELNSLRTNDILEVMARSSLGHVNIIHWNYIFKIKVDPSTLSKTYKTRATLRGDRQIYGIDYLETYAPVVRLKSLRILLATAHIRGWLIHGMDVDTAFLYGVIDDNEPDIYVELPYNYLPKRAPANIVGKLNKHVYGLKQAPRTWYKTISKYLKELEFTPTISDSCLFIRKVNNIAECLISVFVDDLVITTPNIELMTDIKEQLQNKWSMKDLGDLKSILGMKVERTDSVLKLSQTLYIENLLEKYFRGTNRRVYTPLDPGTKLKKGPIINEHEAQPFPYREIIGALNYLAQYTRPDLAFAVSYLAKFSNCHDETHHKAVVHVLRYLRDTKDEGISFTKDVPLEAYGFSDATWGSDVDNSRSVSGYVFYLGGGPITWSSKSQQTVALSSAESEYVAMCSAAKEAIHLKHFLPEVDETIYDRKKPITIYGDNTACIAIAKDPVLHERQKHFDLKLHFVRESIYRKEIELKYIETNYNVADLLTKPSSREMYRRCVPALRGNFDIDKLKDKYT